MKVLLVNDDGFDALGIQSLYNAVGKWETILLAPSTEQSAKGHSFTMSSPLYLTKVTNSQFHLSGTPADCTYFGLNYLCPDVDVVLSGINMGANLGTDIYYSGTVAAAREAFLKGKNAFAYSVMEDANYESEAQRELVYQRAALLAVQIMEQVLEQSTAVQLWNVNFPASSLLKNEVPKVLIKPLGHREYQATVHPKQDPRGREYFWIGGPPKEQEPSDTDVYWCEQGYVVMTPLQLDCTSHSDMVAHQGWTPTLQLN